MKESNRIEITSAGSLPDMLSKEEFFEGFSMQRNQEMMRIFKDLDLVEHLGSGIPRILEAYSTDCFRFTDNFLRMTFPNKPNSRLQKYRLTDKGKALQKELKK